MNKEEKKTRRDSMIRKLREKAEELGRSPMAKDFGKGSSPSYLTIIREFGTWNKALKAAGLDTRPQGRPPKTYE